jgi:outer membrane protein
MQFSKIFAVFSALGACSLSLHAQQTDTLRLTIGDAVTRVLRSSDEARIAREQVELADAQVTQARATGLPQLRLTSNYSQVIENARAAIVGQAIFGQKFNYTGNINVSQTVFQGGRVFSGARAASAFRGAARETRIETESRLSVDAQRAYLQAVLARQLLEIQQRTVTLADERVKQLEQLERAGRASRYDVLRARVERTNLEPALLQAKNNRELAEIGLRRLLNIPGRTPIVLEAELDTARLHEVAQAARTDSVRLDARASVRAAQLTVDARREGVRVALADWLPTVSTFIQTGYTALPTSNGFPTLWGSASPAFCPAGSPATRICQNNGWFPDRTFGVQVSWNLFDGLRTKGSIDAARAQSRIAALQLTAERERVELERATTLAELERAEAAFEAQRQNVGEADEAYRIATLRFDRGLSTLLEVTDAQNALFTAQVNTVRASVDYYLAAADNARAYGAPVPLPPVRPSSR